MINVIKTDINTYEGGLQSVTFSFEFDNASALPIRTYQLGLTTYIIAEGSTAKNISNNTNYTYNNGKWIKVNNSTNNTDSITENGTYNIPNNEITGISNVDVNVESGGGTALGIPKLVSPTAIANNSKNWYIIYNLADNKNYVEISKTTVNDGTGDARRYANIVILQPINTVTFEYGFGGGKSCSVICTPINNSLNIKCYNGSSLVAVTYGTDSPIKPGDYIAGKTYRISASTQSAGSATQYTTTVYVTEYDEPIQFTVE